MRQVHANRPALALAGVIACGFSAAAGATDWLQFGYDVAHSGFNRAEKGYSTASGNTVLYHYQLAAGTDRIDGAPVYLGGVATGSGTRNVLFGLSNNGTIVALAADSTTLNVLWSHRPLGAGTTTSGFGSPVIDPGGQYVYAYGFDGKIHKYPVGNDNEITSGGWLQISTLKPEVEKGAAGLSIATSHGGATYLYSVIDGYIGDANDYQGHLTAIDLGSGAQNVFNALCSDKTIHFCNSALMSCPKATNDCSSKQSGIWGRPGAVYDDGTDRVFIMTGNGPFTANSGGFNWGDSLLALNPDGTGAGSGMPVDSYTPATYANLESTDADFGSASIAIVPAPAGTAAAYQHIAVAGGKDGCVRLVNLADLSGQGGPAHAGGALQTVDFPGSGNCAGGSNGADIKPQPAVWVNPDDGASWVYVATYSHGFAAYKIVLNSGVPSLAQQWTAVSGTSPIVANGTVYYMSGGKLRGLDAVTGASLVTGGPWVTTSFGSQHWQSPILVDGRIYLFNNASPSELWVYQLDGVFKGGFD